MIDATYYPWYWYWRSNDEGNEADCGIYCMPKEGHAYAVVRCPRYLTEEAWRVIAKEICDTHNQQFGFET